MLEVALQGREELNVVLGLYVALLELGELVVESREEGRLRLLEHADHAPGVGGVELLVQSGEGGGASTPVLDLRKRPLADWLLGELRLKRHCDIGRPVLEGSLEGRDNARVRRRRVHPLLVDCELGDGEAHVAGHLLDGMDELPGKLLDIGDELHRVGGGLEVFCDRLHRRLRRSVHQRDVHLVHHLLEHHHRPAGKDAVVESGLHRARGARRAGGHALSARDVRHLRPRAHAPNVLALDRKVDHASHARLRGQLRGSTHVDSQQLGWVLVGLGLLRWLGRRRRRRRRRRGGLHRGRVAALGSRRPLGRRRSSLTLGCRGCRGIALGCRGCRGVALSGHGFGFGRRRRRRRRLGLCLHVAGELAAMHQPCCANLKLLCIKAQRRGLALGVLEEGFEELFAAVLISKHEVEGFRRRAQTCKPPRWCDTVTSELQTATVEGGKRSGARGGVPFTTIWRIHWMRPSMSPRPP